MLLSDEDTTVLYFSYFEKKYLIRNGLINDDLLLSFYAYYCRLRASVPFQAENKKILKPVGEHYFERRTIITQEAIMTASFYW